MPQNSSRNNPAFSRKLDETFNYPVSKIYWQDHTNLARYLNRLFKSIEKLPRSYHVRQHLQKLTSSEKNEIFPATWQANTIESTI